MLNASRRFRYTLDLKKDEEQERRRRMIRAHAQVIRVILEYDNTPFNHLRTSIKH